jgi:hypothetical protein
VPFGAQLPLVWLPHAFALIGLVQDSLLRVHAPGLDLSPE